MDAVKTVAVGLPKHSPCLHPVSLYRFLSVILHIFRLPGWGCVALYRWENSPKAQVSLAFSAHLRQKPSPHSNDPSNYQRWAPTDLRKSCWPKFFGEGVWGLWEMCQKPGNNRFKKKWCVLSRKLEMRVGENWRCEFKVEAFRSIFSHPITSLNFMTPLPARHLIGSGRSQVGPSWFKTVYKYSTPKQEEKPKFWRIPGFRFFLAIVARSSMKTSNVFFQLWKLTLHVVYCFFLLLPSCNLLHLCWWNPGKVQRLSFPTGLLLWGCFVSCLAEYLQKSGGVKDQHLFVELEMIQTVELGGSSSWANIN